MFIDIYNLQEKIQNTQPRDPDSVTGFGRDFILYIIN